MLFVIALSLPHHSPFKLYIYLPHIPPSTYPNPQHIVEYNSAHILQTNYVASVKLSAYPDHFLDVVSSCLTCCEYARTVTVTD